MGNRGSFRQGRSRSRVANLTFILDGGSGAALTTGLKIWQEIPFPCSIEKIKVEADQSGSMVLNLYRLSEAERIAGVTASSSYSICAQSQPTLTSVQRITDTTLSGWDTYLRAEDWLYVNIDSVSSISKAAVSLTLRRYFV